MPAHKKKSKKSCKGKGKRGWMACVMKEYRKNKKGGLKVAMRRAKKKWKK